MDVGDVSGGSSVLVRASGNMDAARSRVAAGLAHDLSNALGAILALAETIVLDPSASSDHHASAHRIQQTACHAARLLQRFGRLGGDTSPTTLDLATNVEELAELLQAMVGPRIQIAVAVAARPLAIVIDLLAIEQILVNLALNARDAMPAGGRLSLELERRGDLARLTVADTGTGMPPQIARRIFEPRFTTKQDGHGMGLAIVQQHVANAGGRVTVESEVGRGSRFVIELPLRRP